MKKIFFLTLVFFAAAFFSQSVKAQSEAQRVELCTKVAGGTFLSSYPVQLAAAASGQRQTPFKQAVAMKKGNQYQFTVCTDEESSGEAYLELFDEAKKVGTTLVDGKTFTSFTFECTKTAYYIIFIQFRDGKEGSAVGIASHVKTL